ncbi:HvfC/BufC family peptide modification chaperone [Nitrospira sp. Kam-Ns4a]
MSRLRELQLGLVESLVAGTPSAVAGAIVPEGSALRSLALYRRLIRINYTQVLAVTYPVLRRLVGLRYFGLLARGYLKRYPSTSGDLFGYGRHLPECLQALEAPRRLVELATLEWACHEVHRAAEAPPLSQSPFDAIASADPSRVRLVLSPAVRLLRLSQPVHRVWLALQSEAPVGEVDDLLLPEEETGVVVARGGGKVEVTPLSRLEYRLLEAMADGQNVAEVERMVVEADPEFDWSRFAATLLRCRVLTGCSVEDAS